MKSLVSGTALFLVIFIMTITLSCASVLWHTTVHVIDLSYVIEQAVKNRSAAYYLMQWTIALAMGNKEKIVQDTSNYPLTITFEHWPSFDAEGLVEINQINAGTLNCKVSVTRLKTIITTLKFHMVFETDDKANCYLKIKTIHYA